MAHVGLLEDNFRIAKLCVTLLQYGGHQVTVYETPQQCLQALLMDEVTHSDMLASPASPGPAKVAKLPVEVLILDLFLPGIDGVDVLRDLMAHPHTQSLPIILCTAAHPAEVARALQVAPHASLVEKPFKLQTLMTAIATALNSPLASSSQ